MHDGYKKIPGPGSSALPVPIGFALIESLQQAFDFLFDHWPGNDGLAWTDAMKCCADDDAVDDASAAFLCALKEAWIGCDRTVEIY